MEAITETAANQEQEAYSAPEPQPIFSKGIGPESILEADASLPEKFKGKSIYDVAESYSSLESEFSKTKSQMKELEEKAKRAEMYEQAIAAQQFQQQAQPVHTQQMDPTQDFNALWERDPALATQTSIHRVEQKLQYALQDLELKNAYDKASKSYPDFMELEPVMKQIAVELLPLVRSDQVGNPVTLDVLYNVARARTEDARLRRAQENGMQRAQESKRERNAAYMEGSTPVGSSQKNFEELSLEEMARALGRVKR